MADVLRLWNEVKQLFDAKRKLDNINQSEMYRKVKSDIEDLGKEPLHWRTFTKGKQIPSPKL